uniref:Uncharacterized protein n=1 Tax=Kalanchoe fedtschenkoi TaxID=63787 RepID=A0A7N0VI06_KALFE
MASSSYHASEVLLLLLLLAIAVHCEFQETNTGFEAFDDMKMRILLGYVTIDDESIVSHVLGTTEDLKILAAIVGRFSLKAFFWADEIGDDDVALANNNNNRTRQRQVFVPDCSELTMYVRLMEEEKELLEKDPGLREDLWSGRRPVKRLRKKMVGFDGTGNMSVSGPIMYRFWGFGVDEVDGFGSLEFPDLEQTTLSSKIEFVLVAKVAARLYDAEAEVKKLSEFLGVTITYTANSTQLYEVPVTMLYSLYF